MGGVGGIVDSGLPRCSYFDTDFFGNDVGDGRGLTTGSPYACKQRCIDYDGCDFWTFRAGWERNCYLKSGDIDGEMRDLIPPSSTTLHVNPISKTGPSSYNLIMHLSYRDFASNKGYVV